jgi:predicted metal-binding membrane protein
VRPANERLVVLLSAALLAGLAWIYLVHLSRSMASSMTYDDAMAAMGMRAARWTITDAALAVVMWAVMMVGMMMGSALPVLLLVARSSAAQPGGRASLTTLVFGGGYFVVWTGFSVVAAIAQWQLQNAAMLSPAMAAASPRVAGIALIVAGAYQLTPIKRACLTHCRRPLDFLMAHFRTGLGGAFRMGLHHGRYCLGCCWALMLVLFVVGVMNLVWVAAIGAFVLIEKTGPHGVWVARVAGVALMVYGAVTLIGAV